MVATKETNESSNNAGINGIAFQYAAAILIFINNLKSVKQIAIEDKEDIRIVLKDDTNIYAQAKSSLEGDRLFVDNHFSGGIKDSLETLYKVKDNNATKLISIFNYRNPFGSAIIKFGDSDTKIYRYSVLYEDIKKGIKNYCNNNEEMLSMLEFWYLRFEGEAPYDDIANIVEKKIQSVDPNYVFGGPLVEKWRAMFENNARSRVQIMDIGLIMGSIYSYILQKTIRFSEAFGFFEEGVEFFAEKAMEKCFNKKLEELTTFEEYSQAAGEFLEFCRNNPTVNRSREVYIEFANSYCVEPKQIYINMFSDFPEKEKIALLYEKTLMVAYSMKSYVIKKIEEVFDYGN